MPIHIQTPVYENPMINARLGKRIYLKMECYQPTGSFKARGIGHLCEHAVASGQRRLVSSSGGNAGYTAAYAGRALGVPVTVVVPETTPQMAQERMNAEGAQVIVHGAAWDESDAHARQLAADNNAAYIHPFDNPLVWEGHASLIDEAVAQCPKPDVIVLAVGGGGLLCGVMEGLQNNGWLDVPVLAVETIGADSLATSIDAGELQTLSGITSIANTLGASRVTPKAFEWAQQGRIIPVRVSDAEAVRAALDFADDMRVVVEPACGAALSLLYDNSPQLADYGSALVIVCGGAGVTIAQLKAWARELA